MNRSSSLSERGGLDPVLVEVAADEPVAFGSAKRLREDLVRNAIKGPVEVLVATAFPANSASTASVQRPDSSGTT